MELALDFIRFRLKTYKDYIGKYKAEELKRRHKEEHKIWIKKPNHASCCGPPRAKEVMDFPYNGFIPPITKAKDTTSIWSFF
ncbi:hypothetical protein RhiirA4_451978 [Rhizophagus irregularis]|uniref:Uncharacterized protein n=1 Tax=Rhizophagus irregularis TaxID=588596 RepID=A0A2I1FWY4_9GLOM|nr:hypothetical protein RhiirA4_451978 [Rhizophagus irregularis]